MLRHILFSLFFIGLTAQAGAQSHVPDRRAIITANIDFYGSDLTALFDITYDACQRACLTNSECQAFTYNSKSNACFPKSAVTDEQPFEGAYSGRIVATDLAVMAQASNRADDLEFLGQGTLDARGDDHRGAGPRGKRRHTERHALDRRSCRHRRSARALD